MKKVKFEIDYQEEKTLDLQIETLRKYPVKSQYLFEQKKAILILKYNPDSALEEEKYIEFLKQKLKRQFNAKSIKVTNIIDS